MDNCVILPASRSLVDAVANLLDPAGRDFSNNLVVFPGKRPSHFLRKCIAGRLQSAFVPPVVLSMEGFIDRMYQEMNGPFPKKLEALDAVAFLFDLHRSMEKPMGGEGFLSLETFFSLGLRIFRDIEELVIEDVDRARFSEFESLVKTPLPPKVARSVQSLSFFYDSFYPALHDAGLSSRSERYRFVSSRISKDLMPWSRIVFAGFYDLTASEKRLFQKIAEWDGAVLLFQDGPGIGEQISFLGIEPLREEEGKDKRKHGPSIHFHRSPDSHGQVFALSGLLENQTGGWAEKTREETAYGESRRARVSLDGTAIVLPSPDSLFSVLYHALPSVTEEDYNISLGYPLERTPTWGFLNNLMQLCVSMDGDLLYVSDYLDFVLHPYTKNIYLEGKAELTRIMFHAIEEVLLQERTRNFVSLDEVEDNEEIFILIQNRMSRAESVSSSREIKAHLKSIHDQTIRRLNTFENVGDFAARITEVLSYIYDYSSARLHPFFHPFAESFMEQLDLLGKSRLRYLAFAEKRGYFHFLKKYIAHCFTPFEGTPLHGLQVLGFLETRGLQFERIYVLDVNEDIIPDTNKEESLIPLTVRKTLNLPTYRERDRLTAYYFDTVIRGASEVHLFWVENGQKEKSRFVERLLWERQGAENAASCAGYVSTLNYRLNLQSNEPPVIEKTPAVVDLLQSQSFDATSLDTYLKCPAQYYYRYVLGLKKKEDARTDVERVDIGRVVHTILLAYFEKRRGSVMTPAQIDQDEMRSLVRSVFVETYGSEPVGAVYLLRQQVLRQMDAYLKSYELPLAALRPARILLLEHKYRKNVDGIDFAGRVDRIDARDGKIWIIDYKTASSPKRYAVAFDKLDVENRQTWSEAIGSIQLPFYLFLTEDGAMEVANREAMFLLLGKAHIDAGIELRLFSNKDDRRTAYENARQVILGLAGEIRDPLTPFDPANRKKDACSYCDYQHTCGTQT